MAIYNKIIHGRCLTNCTTTTVHIADATLWTQAKKNSLAETFNNCHHCNYNCDNQVINCHRLTEGARRVQCLSQ